VPSSEVVVGLYMLKKHKESRDLRCRSVDIDAECLYWKMNS